MTVAEGKAADGPEAFLLELAPLHSAAYSRQCLDIGGLFDLLLLHPEGMSGGSSRRITSALALRGCQYGYIEGCSSLGTGASNVEAFLVKNKGVASCEKAMLV